MTTTIIGVNLENRLETAIEFQKIITEFGCEIRTRIGLHSAEQNICCNRGIVLLEADGNADFLIEEISKYWCVQIMRFE